MVCGYCKAAGFRRTADLEAHWGTTGCPEHRPIWARVLEARKRGSSGRRILHEAFPRLYPSDPMDEETKERLREIQERRKAQGVRAPKRRYLHLFSARAH